MFNETRKLWPHQIDAIIDALAILKTIPEAAAQVEPNTIDHLEAMINIRSGDKISDSMNNAIAEMVENERK